MPNYKRNRKLLRAKHGSSALLLISLNELTKREWRQRSLLYERWADIIFDLGIDHFAISLLPVIHELRDPHQPIKMIKSHWPKGFFGEYYKMGVPKNSLAMQCARYDTIFAWHPLESNVVLRDPELTMLRGYGIKSGLIVPSVIGHSHCALICGDDRYDRDEILTTVLPHAPYLKTALKITHANMLQYHYDAYSPYTFKISPIEKQIYKFRTMGLTAGQIGRKLHKSESLIKKHMADVGRRLKTLNKNDTSITKPERLMPILINSGLI